MHRPGKSTEKKLYLFEFDFVVVADIYPAAPAETQLCILPAVAGLVWWWYT
jgi:tRNA(Ile2) C34 agmatinyltransferase TiaS